MMFHVEPLPGPPRDLAAQLSRYEKLVREHAARLGLHSPATMVDYEEKLLRPCLAFAELPAFSSAGLCVVDLGSGAGLPGIPLAMRHPQHRVLLVDARLKRCQFLEAVAADLQLSNVSVRHGRIEKIRDEAAPDVFVARFLKNLRLMAAWTRRWRTAGTRYLVFAGASDIPPVDLYGLSLTATHQLGHDKVAHEYLVLARP